MRIVNTVIASSVLAIAFAAAPASAQSTYTSRATFQAASGTLATETFSGCGTASTSFNGSVSSTSGPCTGIVAGVTYSPGAGNLYIAGPGQSSNPTTALGMDNPSGNPFLITFAQNKSAFGLDLFQNFGGGSQSGSAAPFTVSFLLSGANVASYNFGVASGTGSFFGFTGAIFDTVRVAQTNGYAVIDNVSFGTVAAVPETATWGMMIAGFGLMGAAMRNRRRSTKVTFA
jgi:hypothetical protein